MYVQSTILCLCTIYGDALSFKECSVRDPHIKCSKGLLINKGIIMRRHWWQVARPDQKTWNDDCMLRQLQPKSWQIIMLPALKFHRCRVSWDLDIATP